jgi:xylose isomerase
LLNGGLGRGGVNFDAKVRRTSFEPIDVIYAHIAGMDSFARGLKVAAKLLEDGVIERFVAERYRSYTTGIGADIVAGKADLKSLAAYALEHDRIRNASGLLELLRAKLNQYLVNVE